MPFRAALRHRLAPLLVALALLARLLVPAGFMPGAGGLVLCSGGGAMTAGAMMAGAMAAAMPDMHGGKPGAPAGGQHDGDHGCPFGALAAAADLFGWPAALPLLPTPVLLPAVAFVFASPGHGLAAPPPPKTGPPVLR